MAKIYLEVPVFSPSSAEFIITQAEHGGGGIARLELNAKGSYGQGGTTPDPNTYRHAATAAAAAAAGLNNQTPTPLRVMIRPRGPPPGAGGDGSPDFVYSEAELDGMEEAIREWRVCGLMDEERGDGFVLGVLQVREEEEGEEGGDDGGRKRMRVDVGRNRRLVDVAAPFPCVFHRAFDDILGSAGSTIEEALADLAACGFKGLLTSGGPGRAIDNIKTVSRIVNAAPDSLQEIIIGGGVRSSNVGALAEVLLPQQGTTKTTMTPKIWFHSSCLTSTGASGEEEDVDKDEFSSIAGHVKAVYGMV